MTSEMPVVECGGVGGVGGAGGLLLPAADQVTKFLRQLVLQRLSWGKGGSC